jgi:serine/threonine protein kinase/pSer/pThr/pTyr-binding forkhead associated (FHA) protein
MPSSGGEAAKAAPVCCPLWGVLRRISNDPAQHESSRKTTTEESHQRKNAAEEEKKGEEAPPVIELRARRVLIGRMPGNDVVLSNPCISATHCCLSYVLPSEHHSSIPETTEQHAAGVMPKHPKAPPAHDQRPQRCNSLSAAPVVSLADCSSNGCFVNERRLGKGGLHSPLESGDVIHLVKTAPNKTAAYNLAYVFHRIHNTREKEEEEEPAASGDKSVVAQPHVTSAAEPFRMGQKAKQEIPPARSISKCQRELEKSGDVLVLPPTPPRHENVCDWQPEPSLVVGCSGSELQEDRPSSSCDANGKFVHGAVDDFFDIDRGNPLGAGAFATVYRGVAKQRSAEQDSTPYAIKIVTKKRLYLTDTIFSSAREFFEFKDTVLRILEVDELLEDCGRAVVPSDPAASKREQLVHELEKLQRSFLTAPQPLRDLFNKELRAKRRQRCEVDVLIAVNHPHIVRLHRVIESSTNIAFVMDMASGGELFELVKFFGPLPEFLVKLLTFQILRAVGYLHRLGITHRDIKLENVLLLKRFAADEFCRAQTSGYQERQPGGPEQSGKRLRTEATITPADAQQQMLFVPTALWPTALLSDFGLSRIVEKNDDSDDEASVQPLVLMETQCGTPMYAAPEVTLPSLRANPAGYTPAIDLFSVGVVAFALLTARPPFTNTVDRQTNRKTSRLDYKKAISWHRAEVSSAAQAGMESGVNPPLPPLFCLARRAAVSLPGRQLIESLLTPNPSLRPTAREALQHPWFAEVAVAAEAQ